jgi:hypothetical protein
MEPSAAHGRPTVTMPQSGCPPVPMPRSFLFDAKPCYQTQQNHGFSNSSIRPNQCAADRSAAHYGTEVQSTANTPVSKLSGCSVDFLLRANTSEKRSEGLELHISQLRTALLELLHVQRRTEAQVCNGQHVAICLVVPARIAHESVPATLLASDTCMHASKHAPAHMYRVAAWQHLCQHCCSPPKPSAQWASSTAS